MRLNTTITAAAVAAALTALAGCDRQADQPPMSSAPIYSKERTATAPPATDPMVDRSTSVAPESSQPGSSQGVQQTLEDASITAKVKAALLASDDVKGSVISVHTEQGRVTLEGKVLDAAQIDRAIQIASAIEGVKEVDNRLSASQAS